MDNKKCARCNLVKPRSEFNTRGKNCPNDDILKMILNV